MVHGELAVTERGRECVIARPDPGRTDPGRTGKGANLILSAEIGKAVAGVLGDTSGRVLLVGSAAADLAGAVQILNAARVIASAGLAIGEASAVYASIIGLGFTGGFVVGTLINDFLIPCNTKIIIGDTILETLNNGPKNVADFYGRSLKTLIRPPSEPLWLDEASGFP
jgi:hypothetical protein